MYSRHHSANSAENEPALIVGVLGLGLDLMKYGQESARTRASRLRFPGVLNTTSGPKTRHTRL